MQAGLIGMPDIESPEEPFGMPYILGLAAVAMLIMLVGAGRLGVQLLVYGLLARIPVIVITWLAVQNEDWDTHYSKLPEGAILPEGTSKLMFLVTPQLTVWIAFTVLVGGLFGCIGAAMSKAK